MNNRAEAKPQALKGFLANPETFATVLSAILVREYGAEVYEWDPETIHIQVLDDFGVNLPEINHLKLVCLFSAVYSGEFYRDPLVFSSTCEILNGTPSPLDELSTDLLPAEIAWAVMEVRLNDDDKPIFSHEVARLAGLSLEEDGFGYAPPTIPWAIVEAPLEFEDGPTQDKWQSQVISGYLADQSQQLFSQISALPWAGEIDMARLAETVSDEGAITPSVSDFVSSRRLAETFS